MTQKSLAGAYFSKKNWRKMKFLRFLRYFSYKNRHQRESFESYLSEVLLDCLELFICSNWTCYESLERISTLEKHISIGWRSSSGSVTFSNTIYEKAKMIVFDYICIFCLWSQISSDFLQKSSRNELQSLKSCQRHTSGGLEQHMSPVYHPYNHRTRKSEMKDFLEFFGKSAILGNFPY